MAPEETKQKITELKSNEEKEKPMSDRKAALQLRAENQCRYDIVSLGEVMLRFDPGEGRIRTTRSFQVCEGGGEYNVARGLRRCFSKRGAIVTAIADNEVGRLLEDLMLTSGLDTAWIVKKPADGLGRKVRNGLNFTERGFGIRGALGCSDRGHTAISQLQPGEVDWEQLFGELGVRWLHTGGIFTALSPSAAEVAKEAMRVAHKYGTIISYDLNYRPSLWADLGGQEQCQRVNQELAQYVDVMIGNEEDFTAGLGFQIEGVDEGFTDLDVSAYQQMMEQVAKKYENFQVIATTLRQVKSATVNDWGAVAWSRTQGFAQAIQRDGLEILDRVGGGDSFASGLIYGLLTYGEIEKAVNYGAAHGALAMTTPGDTSTAVLSEVESLLKGGSARVKR